MKSLEYLLGRPWRDVNPPEEVLRVPTMLSHEELALLYTLARDYASGNAAIVDAGSFLGGSTAALLAGVRDRNVPWAGPPVASYDKFRVEEYTSTLFFADDPKLEVGSSFRPQWEANVAGFDVPHAVHEGDVIEIGWSGGEIDILFLDLVKSWKINDAILRDFFPHLVPGRSVIVQQDYGWGAGPWIHITMELMADSVKLVDGMKAGSHVFFVEEDLPAHVLTSGLRHLDHDQQLELMDRAVQRVDGWARGMVELARTAVLADRDGPDVALREIDGIAKRYSDPYVELCLAYVRESLTSDPTSAAVRHAERLTASDS